MAQAGEKKVRLAKAVNFESPIIQWEHGSQMTPEAAYLAATASARRKHFGQFFTPAPIAELMAEWIAARDPKDVLEPSVGTGVLARACACAVPSARLTCIDLDQAPLDLASRSLPQQYRAQFINGDFLRTNFSERFDAVLANPPYLRHHDISYEIDIHAEIGRRNGVSISRACNIYILFIYEICRLLKDGGRAAIIVPTDWLSANSAQCLREYFTSTAWLKKVLYFDEDDLHFDDALTTSVVLLIEKDTIKPDDLVVEHFSGGVRKISEASVPWSTLKNLPKWNNAFLGVTKSDGDGLIPLESIAETKRGIATGANEFFHLPRSQAISEGIDEKHLLQCIGSARDVRGLIFSDLDYQYVENTGGCTVLANFNGSLNDKEVGYIRNGEARGFHERYLLARRTPWFKTELRAPAPIWAASFGRGRIRFVWNQTSAVNLTTFHCVYPVGLSSAQIGALVCLLNSAPIQQRFSDHIRVMGGGLLKFQPNDLLSIELPDVRSLDLPTIQELSGFLEQMDKSLREGGEATTVEADNYVTELILNGTNPHASDSKIDPMEHQLALF